MAAVVSHARRRRSLQRACGTALALGAIVLLLAPRETLDQFKIWGRPGGLGQEVRWQLWAETIDLIGDYPITGCGLGAYEVAFERYRKVAPRYRTGYAHNDYLQWTAEAGLPAAAAAALFIMAVLAGLLRRVVQTPAAPECWLALGCLGSLVAVLVHGAADFNFYIPANRFAMAWLLGLAAACGVPRQAPLKHPSPAADLGRQERKR
jgi:O-antigen ligase